MHIVAWVIAAVAVFVLALSIYGSSEITKVPFFAVPYTPKEFGWTYEDVTFMTEDGIKLEGWFVPSTKPSSACLIIQHGVGSNHGDMLAQTACLQREGRWNLFYYNFRGHGSSEGHITSLGPLELRDLAGAIKFLKEQKPEQSRHLGIFGHSLGAAVAIVGAARFPELKAVAAESPFALASKTIGHFSRMYYGIPYFPFIYIALIITSLRLGVWLTEFSPVKAIGQIAPRPIYLMQGGRDLRIPMSDFQTLWAAAREPKEQWLVPAADHGDPWMIERNEYEKRLVEFFRKAIPT